MDPATRFASKHSESLSIQRRSTGQVRTCGRARHDQKYTEPPPGLVDRGVRPKPAKITGAGTGNLSVKQPGSRAKFALMAIARMRFYDMPSASAFTAAGGVSPLSPANKFRAASWAMWFLVCTVADAVCGTTMQFRKLS